jgi:endonuclease YncB( thermonuclease family)
MIKVWRLPFLVKAWVDGDTAHGVIDFGWRFTWEPPKGIRLLLPDGGKYDAPERKSPTLTRGNRAKVFAQVLAPAGTWVMITSHYVDPDDFGRPLCSIELEGGQDMAAAMIAAGHVK